MTIARTRHGINYYCFVLQSLVQNRYNHSKNLVTIIDMMFGYKMYVIFTKNKICFE